MHLTRHRKYLLKKRLASYVCKYNLVYVLYNTTYYSRIHVYVVSNLEINVYSEELL